MKKLMIICTLTVVSLLWAIPGNAQSALNYFDTVIDLNTVDEATRTEYFKKISASAKAETEKSKKEAYALFATTVKEENSFRYEGMKAIMKAASNS